MTPASLDPAAVRLNRKLHDLVEAIDAAEHAASLLDGLGRTKGRFAADLYGIRQTAQHMQRELEHVTAQP